MAKRSNDPFLYPHGIAPEYLPANCVVLFFDVVGFTKHTSHQQMESVITDIHKMIRSLLWNKYCWNETVEGEKNDLILIPTGDGYAIGFNPICFTNKEILDEARQIYFYLRGKKIDIRMGIAKGNNIRFKDMNERVNLFGYGINTAKRIMDLALPNQILLHESFAKDVTGGEPNENIISLGEYPIKHGLTVEVYNYAKAGEFGAPEAPLKPKK